MNKDEITKEMKPIIDKLIEVLEKITSEKFEYHIVTTEKKEI